MAYARIVGTGSYLPARIVTNRELEARIDTTDEWIVSRTGIESRHVAADDEMTSDLAVAAAKRAMAVASITPDDVDLIVVATTTEDMVFPSTACLVQAKPGVKQGPAFDLQAVFTGFVSLTEWRRFSSIISRFRIEMSPRTNTEWDLDYDLKTGRINASTALVNYRYGPFTLGGGDAFLRVNDMTQGEANPPQRDFHQYRILFGYGQPQKRGFSGATSFGFDHNQGFLQYSTAQATYNWDCCGLSVEYRRFALGLVRNENQFRFAFSLANVGAFGNLKRQERLY